MRIYIPEIGDRIRLTSDWTFNLHRESRNSEVWNALGKGVTAPVVTAWEEKLAALDKEMRAFESVNFHQVEREWGWGYKATRMVSEPKPGFEDAWEELRERRWDHYHSEATAPLTLPAGTLLSVDRIYIRKGAKEFSSITFYVLETSHPDLTRDPKAKGFKKGRKRFWAKLAEVNTIEAETELEKAAA